MSASTSPSKQQVEEIEEEIKVAVQHKILSISECFVYRIPPMKSSGGHRAEDWNLSNPLATCSVEMLQRDNTLLVNLMGDRPMKNGPTGATEKFLFAQSVINLSITPESHSNKKQTATTTLPIHHWAEPVVDSSRYFVLRIFNEKTKREAHIGIGFRERNDAVNFKMGMQDYERSIQREKKVAEIIENQQKLDDFDKNDVHDDNDRSDETAATNMVSKLTLKEGEKIHINLKTSKRRSSASGKIPKTNERKGGFLLKKPPPPADSNASINSHSLKQTSTLKPMQNREHDEKKQDIAESDSDEEEWGDFQ